MPKIKKIKAPNRVLPDAPVWSPTSLGWVVTVAGVVCEVRHKLYPGAVHLSDLGWWVVFDVHGPARRTFRVPNKKRAVEELRGLLLGRFNEMLTAFGYEEIEE